MHVRSGLALLLLLAMSCSRAEPPKDPITFEALVRELADTDRMARLDTTPGRILTSVDPSGGNDDFNHPVRKGPPGWDVLADLQGPGYVSRFWFTGSGTGTHGLRFYFDGEDTPSLDTTIGGWCGGTEPFTVPLATYENFCWYSYIPIPFQKRLVVMTREGGTKPGNWPRLFYQINYHLLPRGQTIESFPRQLTPSQSAAVQEIKHAWSAEGLKTIPQAGEPVQTTVEIQPGGEADLLTADGPAVIRELQVRYELPGDERGLRRDLAARDLVLRAYWDGVDDASIETPLGDFFGSFWRPMRYQGLFFGMIEDTLYSRFPMPFRLAARISVENQGATPVTLETRALVDRLPAWDGTYGYLHAGWTKTTAQDVGRPHDVVRMRGRGKFVGCVLSACSFDKSWWLLEGDESIRVDGEAKPQWLGTGLEDYFNGGWYYQNALVRALHGLPFKAPFRTVQYRIQLPDPVAFEKSIDMVFERGPDNASHGEMESVGFFYGDRPYRAPSRLGSTALRRPPRDPFAAGTLMTELCNQERLGDHIGARDSIDTFLELVPNFPFVDVLRIRQVAYNEYLQGFPAVQPAYEQLARSLTNDVARQQAEDLLWFHADTGHALLSMYCNMQTRVFLDGQLVGQANSPERMTTVRATVGPGRHTLVAQGFRKPQPQLDWVQVALRTHAGTFGTSPEWSFTYGGGVDPDWAALESAEWKQIEGTGIKGPPEEPFIWTEPNAFINTQSLATGLRPADEWPDGANYILYRTDFEIP